MLRPDNLQQYLCYKPIIMTLNRHLLLTPVTSMKFEKKKNIHQNAQQYIFIQTHIFSGYFQTQFICYRSKITPNQEINVTQFSTI